MTNELLRPVCAAGFALILALATPFADAGQQPATTTAEQAPAPPAKAAPPAPPAAPLPASTPRPEPGQLLNVRIELNISDQRGAQRPVTKSVSMTVSDRGNGSVRSTAEAAVAPEQQGLQQVPLNVDANPTIDGSRIRLRMSVEYSFVDTTPIEKRFPKIEVRESLNVVLEDGKPLVVAQSADPMSDRRVTLEVKASILR